MAEKTDDDEAAPAARTHAGSRGAPPNVRLFFWVAIALVALVFALEAFRIETVSGEQIGFLVNNWTGGIEEIDAAGQVIFCGLWSDFYKIEKGQLQVHMAGPGVEPNEDYVKIKTVDGNDVFVDLTIQYQVDPKKAPTILVENGQGNAYQQFWVRDYARAICRYDYGELRTEEFYVASKRDPKALEARDHLNKLLEPHGIHVTQVLVQNFHFAPEYDEKIREQNLAEQEVERWKSQQQANLSQQARFVQQAKKDMTKQLAAFQGELDRTLERAKGQADKLKLDAEAYAKRVTLAAEANFHKASNEAEAVKAALSADAAGLRALRDAMAGEGGRTLVALEYAKKLEGLKLTGRAVLFNGVVEQFAHENRAAAASPAARAAATHQGAEEGGSR
jgi:regulator of protease activity HflC (stomatin/prohibitin superfamily)